MRRLSRFVLAAFAATLVAPARAEESGCDKFAWSVQPEQRLLQSADRIPASSGKSFDGWPDRAVELTLLRLDRVAFEKLPERAPKDANSFAGLLKIEKAPSGVVEIGLSVNAWVDAIQDERYLRPTAHSGARDCPGIRKVVKFELRRGPVTFQFSGVEGDRLVVLVTGASAR